MGEFIEVTRSESYGDNPKILINVSAISYVTDLNSGNQAMVILNELAPVEVDESFDVVKAMLMGKSDD